jgi:class 3 adenylate cyclase
MGIPLSMAAQAFTTRSLAMVNFVPEFEQIRFGPGIASGDIVVGNLAEPVV